ncbi:MAG: hypothetical protein AAF614_21215 [Chloroflexota bacterium]
MSDDFQWKIEEEAVQSQREAATGRWLGWGRLPRWLLFVLVVIGGTAVVLAGWIFWQRWQVTKAATEELIATHTLLQETIGRQDQELFNTLLQPDDPTWRDAQQKLFAANLNRQLPIMGLFAGDVGHEALPTISFALDFRRAEVITQQPFRVTGPVEETVFLQQTAWYELEDGAGWQLAPPADGDGYWGEQVKAERPFLTLRYPEQDSAISQRLADDINGMTARVCATQEITCSTDFHLNIHFISHPSAIFEFAHSQQSLSLNYQNSHNLISSHHVNMPTPSLVGLPVDEAGYQALFRGYASWLAAFLVINFGAEQAITADSLADLLVRWQLPLPAAVESTANGQPPTQDVLLLCHDENAYLQRYNPATGRLTAEAVLPMLSPTDRLQLWPLPDDSGVAIGATFLGQDVTVEQWQLWLWQAGEVTIAIERVIEENQHVAINSLHERRHSPEQLFWQTYEVRGATGYEQVDFMHINLAGCAIGDCLAELSERMWVSPNGRYTLQKRDADTALLTDQNRMTTTLLEEVGFAVAWLGENNLVYVGADNEETAVYLRHLATPSDAQHLLTLDDLQADVPPETQFFLRNLIADPRNPQRFFLFVDAYIPNISGYGSLLYSYDLVEARLQLEADGFVEDRLIFEAEVINGRYVVNLAIRDAGSSPSSEMQTQITVHNLLTDEAHNHTLTAPLNTYRYDWSQDGDWFLLLEDGLLRLISPDTNGEQTLFHNFYRCSHAAWAMPHGSIEMDNE